MSTGIHTWEAQVGHYLAERQWIVQHCSCGYITPLTQNPSASVRMLRKHFDGHTAAPARRV